MEPRIRRKEKVAFSFCGYDILSIGSKRFCFAFSGDTARQCQITCKKQEGLK